MERLEFYKGMDISSLPECLADGMKIKDFDGTVREPFELLKKYGVNAIRLRIWHTPSNEPASRGYCDLEHTISMAKLVRANGMSLMLDFHYSDFWADPAKQKKPKAWEMFGFEDLEKAVYYYTRDVLTAMKAEGVLPDIVQIGNEIRSGLLFPEGELPDYAGMVRLVNAGIRGARAVGETDELQVMIHLDQGGRYFYLKEWLSKAFEAGLADFDLIGLSYYPFWHGTFRDLKETLERLVEDYKKPLMIVETAHAWRRSERGFIDEVQERIAGVPATPEGQHRVLELVEQIVASLPEKMGLGIYYWEPLSIPTSGCGGWGENMGLLNEDGQVMEGICAFSFRRDQVQGYPLEERIAETERSIALGGRAYDMNGSGDGKETGDMLPNLLLDAKLEAGLSQWDVVSSDPSVVVQVYPEFVDPFPAPPLNALRVESPKNFTFQVSQRVKIAATGSYKLSVEFKGTDTTGVDVRLFAQSDPDGAISEKVIHPTEHAWTRYEISDISCKNGIVTVGIRILAPPMYGMMKNFRLEKV